MNYTKLFSCRQQLYHILESMMKDAGIHRAYIPTISYTVTPESYTDFFQATASCNPEEFYYLQPSPEFYLKKLIAFEQQSFYYLGPTYRANEPPQSILHLPEFDMLEFYKIGYNYEQFIQLSQEIFQAIWREFPEEYFVNGKTFYKEIVIAQWEDLFAQIGINFDDLRNAVQHSCQTQLRSYLTQADDFEICFYKLFYHEIEHKILDGRLWFLSLYPQELGALAKRRNNSIAERFEIFWNGIELMNSYGESNDALFMRNLMEEENNIRKKTGKPIVPIDYKFLECLTKLPAILSGGSLGLDRILFIIFGKQLALQKVQDTSVLYWA